MKSFTSHYKELTRLGLPIVIGQLGIIFVSFADTFMVARHGTNDLAAASFVNNMFNLAIIFATGFSYGLTPIIGKLFGRSLAVVGDAYTVTAADSLGNVKTFTVNPEATGEIEWSIEF